MIEIIVAVSILVILAGIAIPVISKQVDKAKAGKIVTLAETLRNCCERYKGDTGVYGYEYSTSTANGNHRFSITQNQTLGTAAGPHRRPGRSGQGTHAPHPGRKPHERGGKSTGPEKRLRGGGEIVKMGLVGGGPGT